MLSAGDIIEGRYELERVLGRGGFGVVYRARQLSTGQHVAIKVLTGEKIGDGADNELARFHREMELIARLKHPNIVRLIDSGQLPDGNLFTVLEYVDGHELAAVLKSEGALRPAEARDLMFQVLDALSAAHDLGIVHRDMKPQNVMITAHGFRRNAMVLDFGIAGIAEEAREEDYQTLTLEGRIHGTPAYMAPEQLRGHRTTPQIDIYAWGLVFLECLVARKVVLADSMADTIARVVGSDPHPIPAPLLDTPLGAFLARAIAKEPAQRFADARAALEALQAIAIPADATLPWTGKVASDEEMHSGSVSGPVVAARTGDAARVPGASQRAGVVDAQGPGVHSQETRAYDSGSISGPVVGHAPPMGPHSLPYAPGVGETKGGGRGVLLGVLVLLVAAAGVAVWWLVFADRGSGDADADAADDGRASAQSDEANVDDDDGRDDDRDDEGDDGDDGDDLSAELAADPEDGEVRVVEGTRGSPMAYVDGGTVTFGTPPAMLATALEQCAEIAGEHADKICVESVFADQVPASEQTLAPFFLDVTEVTQSSWATCVADGACAEPDYGDCSAISTDGPFAPHSLAGEQLQLLIDALSGEQRPVVCITRAEAAAYCEWAGKRLPTELEWEAVATQRGTTLYPWGDASEAGGRRANAADLSLVEAMRWGDRRPVFVREGASNVDREPFLAAVGSYPQGQPEAYAVHDLAGNVREWVAGEYAPYGEGGALVSGSDGDGVSRGGGWADLGPWLSGRGRRAFPPDTRRTDLGVRCAADSLSL